MYFNKGKSLIQIYRETSIAPQTIRRIFKENGLILRTKAEAIGLAKK